MGGSWSSKPPALRPCPSSEKGTQAVRFELQPYRRRSRSFARTYCFQCRAQNGPRSPPGYGRARRIRPRVVACIPGLWHRSRRRAALGRPALRRCGPATSADSHASRAVGACASHGCGVEPYRCRQRRAGHHAHRRDCRITRDCPWSVSRLARLRTRADGSTRTATCGSVSSGKPWLGVV